MSHVLPFLYSAHRDCFSRQADLRREDLLKICTFLAASIAAATRVQDLLLLLSARSRVAFRRLSRVQGYRRRRQSNRACVTGRAHTFAQCVQIRARQLVYS